MPKSYRVTIGGATFNVPGIARDGTPLSKNQALEQWYAQHDWPMQGPAADQVVPETPYLMQGQIIKEAPPRPDEIASESEWVEPRPVMDPQPADDFAYDASFQAAGPVRAGGDKADRKLLAKALAGHLVKHGSPLAVSPPPMSPRYVGPPTQLPMLSDRAVQEAIAAAPKEAKPLIRQLAMAMAGHTGAGHKPEKRRGAKT